MKDKEGSCQPFTMNDLESCWSMYKLAYFLDILNGEYALNDAREDLRGMIGTKYDLRKGNNDKR